MTNQQKEIVRNYITDMINNFSYCDIDCMIEDNGDIFTPPDADLVVEYLTKLKVVEK